MLRPRQTPRPTLDDIDEELRAHLELSAHHQRTRGLDPDAASARALARFGHPDRIRAAIVRVYEPWPIRIGRALGRIFISAATFATLVALLSVVAGLTVRTPRTFPADEVWVSVWHASAADRIPTFWTPDEYEELKARDDVFEAVTAARYASTTVSGPFPGRIARVKRVAPEYFQSLGVQPVRGRTLSEADAGAAVAMLTDRAWQEWFARSSDAVGVTINIGGTPHTVVGVLPPHLRFFYDSWVVTPISWDEEAGAGQPRLLLGGHVRPDVGIDQATERLVASGLSSVRLMPVREAFGGPFLGAAVALAVLAWLVCVLSHDAPLRMWAASERAFLRAVGAPTAVGLGVGVLAAVWLGEPLALVLAEQSAGVFDVRPSIATVATAYLLVGVGMGALALGSFDREDPSPGRARAHLSIGLRVCATVVVVALLFPLLMDGLRDRPGTLPRSEVHVAALSSPGAARRDGWGGTGVDPSRWAYATALPSLGARVRDTVIGGAESRESVEVGVNAVSENFFPVSGLAIVVGHGLAEGDGGVVIDRRLASAIFPAGDAVGQTIRLGSEARPRQVRGVAQLLRYETSAPTVYRIARPDERSHLLAFGSPDGGAPKFGPDLLGPLDLETVIDPDRRRSRAAVGVAAVMILAQLLALAQTLQPWSAWVVQRRVRDSGLGRQAGAARLRIGTLAAFNLISPVLIGSVSAVLPLLLLRPMDVVAGPPSPAGGGIVFAVAVVTVLAAGTRAVRRASRDS